MTVYRCFRWKELGFLILLLKMEMGTTGSKKIFSEFLLATAQVVFGQTAGPKADFTGGWKREGFFWGGGC